jgi:hypothetical protein
VSTLLEPGGILLSADVFQTAWFECLAAFVAFNTLIYVGLTLAKLIAWPRIMRPVEIRAWLERTLRRPASSGLGRRSLPAARKGGVGTASSRISETPATARTHSPEAAPVTPSADRAGH